MRLAIINIVTNTKSPKLIFALIFFAKYDILNFQKFQKKIDKLYIFVVEQSCTEGIRHIKIQYKGMIGKLKSSYESKGFTEINHWREEFKHHKTAFRDNEKSFEKKSLKELFQLTYEKKCSESIKPLMEVFQEVITVRSMYLHINCVFYEDDSGKKDEHATNLELEEFSKCMKDISSAMSEICPFFDVVRTLKQEKTNIEARNFDTSKFASMIFLFYI